jgi:NitT/TauT family transport system substrate-binding protein
MKKFAGCLLRRRGAVLFIAALTLLSAFRSPVTAADETATLQVGTIPIIDVAPLYLGVAKGFFRAAGLTIVFSPAQGGAAIVPAVIKNDDQIGFSNTVSLLLARAHGIPVQIVSAGSQASGAASSSPAAVVVENGSAIRKMSDLRGKTIAVNTLHNIGDTTIRAVLDQNEIDSADVHFVEMGFAEMPSALKRGVVDAIWANEPFLTAALQDGARTIFDSYNGFDSRLAVAVYFTSDSFATSHPELVRRFQQAMSRSLLYAQTHADAARAILASYTGLEKRDASRLRLPGWKTTIDEPSLSKLEAAMMHYGLLSMPVEFGAILPASVK